MNTSPGSHPSDEVLRAYGFGKLDDAAGVVVGRHVEVCAECRGRVSEMTSDSFLGRMRDAGVVPVVGEGVGSSLTGMSMAGGGGGGSAPVPASTLPPGLAEHSDYEVLRELGRGGMGVVYLAQNTLMGRPEVLKVVGSHLISRPEVLDRFLREIRSAAKLHHPNIVTAYSALRMGDSLVLTMEYVEGFDLARMVKGKGPLSVAHACNFIYQAALGLQHAHERGMVHRDIKPPNLMLARDGKKPVIKVLDFGLAKVTMEGPADHGLTREGQMLGTPDYIAPEQIRNAQAADIRADVYSLGCTLYYLLMGKPPFRGDNLWDLVQAHFSMDAMPLNLARPEVPVELAALVGKMMAKDADKRFQTPGEVAKGLVPFFRGGGPSVRSPLLAEVSLLGQRADRLSSPGPLELPTPAETKEAGLPLAPVVTLIEDRPVNSERTNESAPVVTISTSKSRPKRILLVATAAVLLLGFFVAWGVILRIRTANGTIELVDLPADAEVLIDEKSITVTSPAGGRFPRVSVPAGEHRIVVKHDGFEISSGDVTVVAGEKETLVIRQSTANKQSAERPKLREVESTRTANNNVPPEPTSPAALQDHPDSLLNSVGMTLKFIPGGSFKMRARRRYGGRKK
jgi:serine/threonine protein kinase